MNSSQRPFENETQQGLPFGRGSTDPHALSNACRQLSTKLGRSLLAEALKGPALLDLLREAIEEIARGHASRTVHLGTAHSATADVISTRAIEPADSSTPLDATPEYHDVSGAPALWTAGLWAPSEPLPPSLETTPGRDVAQEQRTESDEDSSRDSDSDSDADAEREIEETVEASKPSHLEQLTAAHDISALFEPALRSTLEAFESEADDEPASALTEVTVPQELTPAEAKVMLEDELPAPPAETVQAEEHAETTCSTSAEHESPLTIPAMDESAHSTDHDLAPIAALESTPVAAQESETPGSEPLGHDWLFEDSLLDSDLSFLGAAEEESFGLIDPDASLSDDAPSPGGLIPSFHEMFAGLVGDDENLEVSQLLDGNDSNLDSFGLGDDDRAPIETTGATVREEDPYTEALSSSDSVRTEQPAQPPTDTYHGEQAESLFLDPEALGALESDAFEDFTPTPFGDAEMDESWALDWEAGWNDSDWATAIPGDAESHASSAAQVTASSNGAPRTRSNGVDPQFEDWTTLRHDLESNIEEALNLVRNDLPDTLDEMLDDIDDTLGGSSGGAFDDEVGSDDASVWMPPRWDIVDQFQDDPELSPSHEPSTLALLDDAPSSTKNEGPTIEELHAALESGKVSDRSTAEMQSLLDELRGVVTADQNELGHVASNVGYLRSELQILRDDVEASGRVSAELLNRMIALNETGSATESQPAPSLVPTVLAAMGMGLVLSTWTLFFYYRSRDFRLALGCLIIANLVGFAFLLASFAKGPKTPR